MPEKDPFGYQWIMYTWVIGLSMLGGIVSYVNKMERFSFAALLGEVTTAGFIGLLTFWICEAVGAPMMVTAPTIGIASHMGSRLIFTLERVFEARLTAVLGRLGIIKCREDKKHDG